MTENIISTLETISNGLIRIRERNLIERLDGAGKFIIEILVRGAFIKIYQPYFKTKDEAQYTLDKIQNLDSFYVRKKKAMQKLKDSFLESIEGTREYDFYEAIGQLSINDYDNPDGEPGIAKFSTDGLHFLYPFLRKYGYPTEFKSLELIDMYDSYQIVINGYGNKIYCLFDTNFYEFEMETSDGDQYRYLLEIRLHIMFHRYL